RGRARGPGRRGGRGVAPPAREHRGRGGGDRRAGQVGGDVPRRGGRDGDPGVDGAPGGAGTGAGYQRGRRDEVVGAAGPGSASCAGSAWGSSAAETSCTGCSFGSGWM